MDHHHLSKVNVIKCKINSISDFPKKGVTFRDIFSVLKDPQTFGLLIEVLKEKILEFAPEFDSVLGLDSRGFIFGSILAHDLKKPFIPIRKKGKLPGEVAKIDFQLEYGKDTFEIQKASVSPGSKVIIVDDLLATGGTMQAAAELATSVGAEVLLCLVCIELTDLNGREKLKSYKVESVVTF